MVCWSHPPHQYLLRRGLQSLASHPEFVHLLSDYRVNELGAENQVAIEGHVDCFHAIKFAQRANLCGDRTQVDIPAEQILHRRVLGLVHQDHISHQLAQLSRTHSPCDRNVIHKFSRTLGCALPRINRNGLRLDEVVEMLADCLRTQTGRVYDFPQGPAGVIYDRVDNLPIQVVQRSMGTCWSESVPLRLYADHSREFLSRPVTDTRPVTYGNPP